MVGESEGQPTDDICPRFRSSSVIPNQYTPSPALFPFPRPPPLPHRKTHGLLFCFHLLYVNATPSPHPHRLLLDEFYSTQPSNSVHILPANG